MSKLSLNFQGFLKFLSRANNEIISWYDPVCQGDAVKIVSMAAREWEAMSDHEQSFFIGHHNIDTKGPLIGGNAFKMAPLKPALAQNLNSDCQSSSKIEKQELDDATPNQLEIAHVIENRNKLHQLYEPNMLNKLEFLIKTKPSMSLCMRTWFSKLENCGVDSKESARRWKNLTKDQKRLYEGCAILDRRRYHLEKKAWFTKVLMCELNSRQFSLEELELDRSKSNVDTIASFVQSNKAAIQTLPKVFKRPLTAFSLYIRAYRYQIRDEHPEFQFGEHLRSSGEAWSHLTEEEKQKYKDEAKELLLGYKNMVKDEESKCPGVLDMYSNLFKHSKDLGPTKPSHLLQKRRKAKIIFFETNNIPKSERQASWDKLTEEEKAFYKQKEVELSNSAEAERVKVRKTLECIRELIRESEKLELVKKDLKLIEVRDRPVRLHLKI